MSSFTKNLLLLVAIALGIVAIILILFGSLFLMASAVENPVPRLITGGSMTGIGFVLIAGAIVLVAYRSKIQPDVNVVQNVSVTVPTGSTVKKLTCDNCGGILDRSSIKMKDGVISIVCPYCDTVNEFSEEPKW
ncbi:MAG: hypothetical protein EAX96_18645 [Candidatus Lokiarchaeota archaeon]|nr:hypothetical protein [Candidatus Lokiarchaeota archaeon]